MFVYLKTNQSCGWPVSPWIWHDDFRTTMGQWKTLRHIQFVLLQTSISLWLYVRKEGWHTITVFFTHLIEVKYRHLYLRFERSMFPNDLSYSSNTEYTTKNRGSNVSLRNPYQGIRALRDIVLTFDERLRMRAVAVMVGAFELQYLVPDSHLSSDTVDRYCWWVPKRVKQPCGSFMIFRGKVDVDTGFRIPWTN